MVLSQADRLHTLAEKERQENKEGSGYPIYTAGVQRQLESLQIQKRRNDKRRVDKIARVGL